MLFRRTSARLASFSGSRSVGHFQPGFSTVIDFHPLTFSNSRRLLLIVTVLHCFACLYLWVAFVNPKAFALACVQWAQSGWYVGTWKKGLLGVDLIHFFSGWSNRFKHSSQLALSVCTATIAWIFGDLRRGITPPPSANLWDRIAMQVALSWLQKRSSCDKLRSVIRADNASTAVALQTQSIGAILV